MRLARSVAVNAPRVLLLHLTDAREGDALKPLMAMTDAGFLYAAIEVEDWNRELSPWPAPPAFGSVPFGGQARQTLDALCRDILPRFDPALPRIIGGYSLAGLFALWAQYETGAFAGVAAASPSVWYPGWDAYADAHAARGVAYLSLGDREARTRNRQMAAVADAIRRQARRFEAVPSTLEWNPGNHFNEPERRMAKAFSWTLDRVAGGGLNWD